MFDRKFSIILAFVLVLAFGAVAFAQTATPGAEMGTNSVTVQDQAVDNGTVMVQQVIAAQPGFIVIHADNNGAPGAILGSSPVTTGTNDNVQVTIDQAGATSNTMWAMLHSGEGTFSEATNPPVMDASGTPVQKSFTVTGLQAAQATATTTTEVTPTATLAAATPEATVAAAAATPVVTTTVAAVTATRTASPATLPTTGGSNSNMLVVLLLGLGGLSLLAGLGLNLVRRSR